MKLLSPRPAFSAPLDELAAWVRENNNDLFCTGDFPATDELTDAERRAAHAEYDAMADEIESAAAIPCDHFQSDGRGCCINCNHFHSNSEG